MDSYKGRQKHGQKDSKTKYMDKKPFKFLQKYIPVIVLRQSDKNLKQQTYNNMDREANKKYGHTDKNCGSLTRKLKQG